MEPVKLTLVRLDGNAFALMGAFSRAARRQGWSKEQIEEVLTECRRSDYDHLIATLCKHTVPEDDDL